MRTFCILLCLMVGACFAADPNDIEKQAKEVEAMVKEFPVKEKALKTKEYTGTIDMVLTQRVADVNEVLVYAKEMIVKAKEVCELLDLKVEKKDYLKAVIDRHGKVKEKEKQAQNITVLEAVVSAIDESAIPVTDPNYVAHNDRMLSFLAAVVEICTPK